MDPSWPSVNRQYFTSTLARSVECEPVFSPSERSLGHRAIPAQSVPVNPPQFVNLGKHDLPECQDDLCCDPLLKAIAGDGFGTQLGLVEVCPLAARAEHVNNGVGTSRSGTGGPSSPKRWGFLCVGSRGMSTIHSSSETRNPVVIRLCEVGVRVRSVIVVMYSCLRVYQVIRMGSEENSPRSCSAGQWSRMSSSHRFIRLRLLLLARKTAPLAHQGLQEPTQESVPGEGYRKKWSKMV